MVVIIVDKIVAHITATGYCLEYTEFHIKVIKVAMAIKAYEIIPNSAKERFNNSIPQRNSDSGFKESATLVFLIPFQKNFFFCTFPQLTTPSL